MNKVYFIESHGVPIGEEKIVKVDTGESKRRLFGGQKPIYRKEKRWEQTGFSDSKIDLKRLAEDIADTLDEIEKEGMEVLSITPITSGNYDFEFKTQLGRGYKGGWGYGYGFGYSYTEGVVIIAKKV